MTAPTAGISYAAGVNTNIGWDLYGDFDGQTLKGTLQYSTTGLAGTFIDIDTNVTLGASVGTAVGTKTYAWQVADVFGANNYIKLKLNGEVDLVTSDTGPDASAFTIRRDLAITYPAGGESLKTLDVANILWNYKGQTSWGTVKIEYTIDSGVNWLTAATGRSVGGGSPDNPPTSGKGLYAWTIPNTAVSANGAKVRVTSETDTSITSTSSLFTIIPSVQLNLPNGGETLYVGNVYNITWSVAPAVSNVKLEYSINGGSSWVVPTITDTVASSPASFPWTVPNAVGTNVRVRVTDTSNATYTDSSNASFIIKSKISGVTPNGTTNASNDYNQNIPIGWTPGGTLGNVRVKLGTDGTTFPTTIISSTTGATGSATWSPGTQAPGSYYIRVVELDGINNEIADVFADLLLPKSVQF